MYSQRLSVSIRSDSAISQAGFSLIELLLSVTLGLILIAGMFTVYVSNVSSAALNTATANMQQALRFGLNVLEEDVRMAGYQGCMNQDTSLVDIIALESPSDSLVRTAISGAVVQTNGNWAPAPELGSFSPPISVTPRIGTHTLAVQYAETPGSKLGQAQQLSGSLDASGPLELANAIDLAAGDLAVVSTCDFGEIFGVSGTTTNADGSMSVAHSTGSNTTDSFQQIYGVGSQIDQTLVMPFVTRVFFVADTGEQRQDGTALYALYQQTMPFDEDENPPTVLIEGVENMQIKFGIRSSNGQLQYVSASDTAYDPTNIRSVRIGLLMSSYYALLDTPDTKTYSLSGENVSVSDTSSAASTYSNDKHFRIAVNTTVTVRNRRSED